MGEVPAASPVVAGYVLDTHAAVWYFSDCRFLSKVAQESLDEAWNAGHPLYLSTISVVEMIYLVEKRRLPSEAVDRLLRLLESPAGLLPAALEVDIVKKLRDIPRDLVPDMPDRIIAATAFHLRLPLVTCDKSIQSSGIPTLW